MSDSTVFQAGQSLRRRQLLKAAAAGTVAVTAGAASSGTVAADDDGYLPEPGIEHAFINPGLVALYNYVRPSSDGYTKESVEDMTAENIHWRIYQGAQAMASQIEGAMTNLHNYIQPSDPIASPQAEMAYSVLRTTAFQAVQDGDDPSVAAQSGRDAALEELDTPVINVLNQWNELVYEYVQWAFTFVPDEEIEWTDSVDHGEGETLEGFDGVDFENDDGLPNYSDIFHLPDWSDEHSDAVAVQVDEYPLPSGDTHEIYELGIGNSHSTYNIEYIRPDDRGRSMNGNRWEVEVLSPEGDGVNIIYPGQLDFISTLDALDDIASHINSEAGDIIEEIMDAYNAGDVGDMDVLSSYDLVREYGDSNEMTRYTAELLAAGLDAQEDVTHQVTIDHPDTGEQTGRLFLSWFWAELADWEYSYDAETQTLEIAEQSIDDDPELVAVFDDDGSEVTETITGDDLDAGSYEFDADNGTLEAVERESQGELSAHIPVGETTDHWNSAIFLRETDDGASHVTLDTGEPFDLVAVEDEDGDELDVLELTGWQNQERDPALSLQEAQRASNQYTTVDELEETAHGGGGGGGGTDTDALLIGGGIIALIGMIIAALSSGGS